MKKNMMTMVLMIAILSTPTFGTLQLYMGREVDVDYDIFAIGHTAGTYATMVIIDCWNQNNSLDSNANIIVRYGSTITGYNLMRSTWTVIDGFEADVYEQTGLHYLDADGFIWPSMQMDTDPSAEWHQFYTPRTSDYENNWTETPIVWRFEQLGNAVSGGWIGYSYNSTGSPPVVHTPEPTTVALLVLGFGWMMMKARKRNT